MATVFGRGENPINFVSVHDVARWVELAVNDRGLRGEIIEVGGPEDLTLNALAEMVAAESGRPSARARHIPLAALRAGQVLVRPFRPDLAGLIEAAVRMDTTDMSFYQGAAQRAPAAAG